MRLILALALLLLPTLSPAAEITLSAGVLANTNVGGSARGGKPDYVAEIGVAKTYGRITPYTSVETFFGDHNGAGALNPVSAKWTVGARVALYRSLYLVLDHYSWHKIDGYAPTEKYTALKLQHKFTW